ncbi:MAG: pseudouridine synthase [Candidatus Caldipriscus sp.]
MRLLRYVQRFYGISRRKAWDLIMEGKVRVNGEVVRQPMMVLKGDERVEVENLEPKRFVNFVYVAFYKPRGYVVSKVDRFNRTIYEILPEKFKDLNAVGRLDKDSEGLLLLTNDGELIHRLTHPRYGIRRGYLVEVDGRVDEKVVKGFLEGVEDRGEILRAVECKILGENRLFVVLKTGKYREIRRMAEKFNLKVLRLKRVFYGNVKLDLEVGKWRYLREDEVKALKSLVGMPP